MVAAQAIGIARAALEYATCYATEREAFGGPIIDNQGIAFPLADLATQIDAARLLTWRASWMAANDVPFERGEGSMSKLAASEVAVKATERAIQTMGGWGYITDHPVEKWYRDAKLYTIFEGTSEIQRMVISNALGAAVGTPPLHVVIEPSGVTVESGFRSRDAPRFAPPTSHCQCGGCRTGHAARHEVFARRGGNRALGIVAVWRRRRTPMEVNVEQP